VAKTIRGRSRNRVNKVGVLVIAIVLIAFLGVVLFNIVTNALKYDCPDSIREFVRKYPEAMSLAENFSYNAEREVEMALSDNDMVEEVPLLIQWDQRWGYYWYGDDYFGTNGCGPTCMAMVYAALSGDSTWSPARFGEWADSNGYYWDGSGTAWSFMTEGAEKLGLTVQEISMTETTLQQALAEGSPVICNVGPGVFTKGGHYIVIAGFYEDGTIRINDPNSPERSSRHWIINEFKDQVRAAWKYQY